jgi:hypothetical protein
LQLTVDNGAEHTFWFLIERKETTPSSGTELIDARIVSAFETHSFATIENQPVQSFTPAQQAGCRIFAEHT